MISLMNVVKSIAVGWVGGLNVMLAGLWRECVLCVLLAIDLLMLG